MRAIRIIPGLEPNSGEVSFFDLPPGIDAMYAALSYPGFRPCDDFNMMQLGPKEVLWVDGEGLLIPNLPAFQLNHYPQLLGGIGLITGMSPAGDNVSTSLSLAQVLTIITWTNKRTSGRLTPTTEGPGYIRFGDPIWSEDS